MLQVSITELFLRHFECGKIDGFCENSVFFLLLFAYMRKK